LPNVLLLGDSITRAYYPETAKELDGVANVYLFSTSCSSGDPRLVGQIRDYFAMASVPFSVVHFNNGMHGWGYSEVQYSNGLPGLISALRAGAPKSKLVWATTTPIRKDAPDVGRTNMRIEERNRLAAAVMRRDAISIDDQHALMMEHQDMHGDDVHFTKEGSAMQAKKVADSLRGILKASY
jgi:lysophospholipase L1-like esterase